MDERINDIVKALRAYAPAQLDQMPDIDLYKDQVITYLKKELALFQEPMEAEIITSSIINNYVKDKIVPRPVKKRYSTAQLAPLIMACILKRAVSMTQIKTIMASMDAKSGEELYEKFCDALELAITDEIDKLINCDMTIKELALVYSLKAGVDCTIADRLIKLAGEEQ